MLTWDLFKIDPVKKLDRIGVMFTRNGVDKYVASLITNCKDRKRIFFFLKVRKHKGTVNNVVFALFSRQNPEKRKGQRNAKLADKGSQTLILKRCIFSQCFELGTYRGHLTNFSYFRIVIMK